MTNYKVILPPVDILTAFENQVRPWLEVIPINIIENQHLAATRDYLLPKLLSGEIGVEAAAEMADGSVG